MVSRAHICKQHAVFLLLEPNIPELQILDILLDVPQRVRALPQLGHLIILQLLVDDTHQARGT